MKINIYLKSAVSPVNEKRINIACKGISAYFNKLGKSGINLVINPQDTTYMNMLFNTEQIYITPERIYNNLTDWCKILYCACIKSHPDDQLTNVRLWQDGASYILYWEIMRRTKIDDNKTVVTHIIFEMRLGFDDKITPQSLTISQ